MFIKRILMSELDAGGASAIAPAPAPDVPPQAQGAPVLSKEIADAITSTVTQAVAGIRDSIFAEARRTFTVPKQKAPAPDATPAPVATATPAQPDPIKLRALDRSLTKAGLATELSQSQYERAERAFAQESPEDVDGWVTDYFAGFKGSHVTPIAQPAATAPPKITPNAQPASDRGSPPPAQVPLAEADISTMSESDRVALIKEKGLAWFVAKHKAQSKGKRVGIR